MRIYKDANDFLNYLPAIILMFGGILMLLVIASAVIRGYA